ncbi:hypothetical protein LTR94_023793 [Friedmanniomyces endolithicus]|nr:hypothetical protein LTR94_023793 [Friedmanniomyces endolithicus]
MDSAARLYEKVSRDLALRIAQGEFKLGSRLPAERQLAQTYEVSRPTVREAIIALELDGLIEVRKGSGVYVKALQPTTGGATSADVGPFELLEARRLIEGEVCALAAVRATGELIAELDQLVDQMEGLQNDPMRAEEVDRRFHMRIAEASLNSAMTPVVEMLWDARSRSAQYRLLSDKARGAGVVPREDEHRAIVRALESRDPDRARAAMRAHLARVLDALLEATEVHELELARQRVASQRGRFTLKV